MVTPPAFLTFPPSASYTSSELARGFRPVRDNDDRPAIAITGAGAISAYGIGAAAFYEGLMEARPVIGELGLPGLDDGARAWGSVVGDVELPDWMSDQVRDGTDVFAQWAMVAAEQAIVESGAEPDPLRTAVVLGTSLCGVQSIMRAQYEIDTGGAAAFPRKTMMKALTNMGAAQIAMRHGLHGPSLTVTTACASTLDALGTAGRLIEFGLADAAVVCGVEAGHTLTSGGAEGGFVPAMAYAPAMFGMHSSVTTPEEACRPFDVNCAGIAGSEGATAFFLECADIAESRGARALGHLTGYGAVSDAHHPSAPEPSGRWEERAMRLALDHSGFEPAEVDCLYAHATGTPVGDPPEIRAINAVFGERAKPLPVTSVKGHFGHAAAASGGMSLIAGLGNMAESTFVNTANTTDPDPEIRFDVELGAPVGLEIDVFQVNAFGFGGQNASVVISRHPRGRNSGQ